MSHFSSIKIKDENGNYIISHPDANGDYHLGTAFIQDILTSDGNSTTENLASGATFTGTTEEAFGINGIQFYLFTDQDTTYYVEQSLDGTNFDISDPFQCLANEACTRTVISVAPYFRIRITNNGDSTTTIMRAAAGMAPMINPMPRTLSPDARLKSESTIVGQQNIDRHVWVSSTNNLLVSTSVLVVGTVFDGTVKDPNYYTETVAGSGAVEQDGEIELTTGITANSAAAYQSVRRGRFVVGSGLQFVGAFKFVTDGTVDNVRRCGAYDVDDGFFFQLDGTVFSVGSRNASADTLISSGSFNGNYGPSFTPTTTAYYKLDIEWTPIGVFYYVNGVLLHKTLGGHLTGLLTLPIKIENVNDNNSVSPVTFDCLGVAIMKQGQLETSPVSRRVSGTSVTVLKYSAGVLKGIVISAVVNGADINIYDGTSTGGTLIWASGNLAAKTEPFNIDFYGLPFSNGLTLEIADSSADVLTVYE